MKKTGKRLAIAALVLVVLIVGVFIVAIVSINSIAKAGIEKGGTYALGVPTTVGSVSIGLTSGQASLSDLNVANPAGFKADHFLKLGKGEVAVTLGSLLKNVVEIPTLTLENTDVRLERTGDGGNYQTILDNLKKATGGDKPSGPTPPSGDEKKFVINHLVIRNTHVEANMLGAGGKVGEVLNTATNIPVTIELIELRNVGKTGSGVGGTGVTMGELTKIIVQAVLSAAMEKGGGLFPADMVGDIQGRLADLGSLKDFGMQIGGKAGEAAKEAAKKAEQTVKGATEDLKKGAEDVKKGLEGLIPGKKKDDK
jgi:uncharacterized protein involved in outer membrane biogenesis